MGMVYTEITLKNAADDTAARRGYIKSEEIRTVTVTAIADTGSMHMVITEELCEKLGLSTKGEKTVLIANGQRVRCIETEAVEIQWKDRTMAVSAMVIPGAKRVLFGAIPMEGMDLMVNPVTQEVVGAHGDVQEILALTA